MPWSIKPHYRNNASTNQPQYQSNNASTHPPHYQNNASTHQQHNQKDNASFHPLHYQKQCLNPSTTCWNSWTTHMKTKPQPHTPHYQRNAWTWQQHYHSNVYAWPSKQAIKKTSKQPTHNASINTEYMVEWTTKPTNTLTMEERRSEAMIPRMVQRMVRNLQLKKSMTCANKL